MILTMNELHAMSHAMETQVDVFKCFDEQLGRLHMYRLSSESNLLAEGLTLLNDPEKASAWMQHFIQSHAATTPITPVSPELAVLRVGSRVRVRTPSKGKLTSGQKAFKDIKDVFITQCAFSKSGTEETDMEYSLNYQSDLFRFDELELVSNPTSEFLQKAKEIREDFLI